jgi:hypothetical protein
MLFVAGLGLASAGCEEENPPPSNTPTPIPVTERFSGSLTLNSAVVFPFPATTAGDLTATVTAISPEPTTIVGLALGTWNGVSCQVVIDNPNATTGITVTGKASAAGNLCARIYDAGKLTTAISFEITVVHP